MTLALLLASSLGAEKLYAKGERGEGADLPYQAQRTHLHPVFHELAVLDAPDIDVRHPHLSDLNPLDPRARDPLGFGKPARSAATV